MSVLPIQVLVRRVTYGPVQCNQGLYMFPFQIIKSSLIEAYRGKKKVAFLTVSIYLQFPIKPNGTGFLQSTYNYYTNLSKSVGIS